MSKICCFSGHRDIDYRVYGTISEKLEELLSELIENEGFTDFRAGGAVGFDLIAASCVLKVKGKYPQIKLHLILPCKNQDKNFLPIEKRIYKYTILHADSVSYVQEKYSDGVMLARDRALVDGSDLCVAYLTRLRGGTYYTVNHARKSGVKVINIAKK